MNQLSWILYWADVLPNVATAFAVMSMIGAIMICVFWFVNKMDRHHREATALVFDRCIFFWPPLLLVFAITFFVPSKETFYAIAVSQTGEQVLKTPEVGKARQALNAWLDKQIKATQSEDEKHS